MNKMVINHLEKLFVTNDAATVIKELEVEHPAAKMIVMATQMMEQEVRGGEGREGRRGGQDKYLKVGGGGGGLEPCNILSKSCCTCSITIFWVSLVDSPVIRPLWMEISVGFLIHKRLKLSHTHALNREFVIVVLMWTLALVRSPGW